LAHTSEKTVVSSRKLYTKGSSRQILQVTEVRIPIRLQQNKFIAVLITT